MEICRLFSSVVSCHSTEPTELKDRPPEYRNQLPLTKLSPDPRLPPPPTGNQQDIDKFSRRLVKVTKTHVDECKQLLKLMGIPYVEVRTAKPRCSFRLLSLIYGLMLR